ncbi:hypothetical protein CVT26_010403 [Gymnopilus dilepis]|uniref:Uncharacterized protein n=1 Tax=Gymnopilus dilepis TaxID=231916 RepID=A0A409VZ89_9AGAR|nr:hypothetical protein CVT26_010403 [Gymnopilus dilepis]
MVDTSCFDKPPGVETYSATVITGSYKYLVVGYVDEANEAANVNLLDVVPRLAFRGEVVIFSLGKTVPVLSYPSGNRYTMETALKIFIVKCIEARAYHQPFPQQLLAQYKTSQYKDISTSGTLLTSEATYYERGDGEGKGQNNVTPAIHVGPSSGLVASC